MHVTGFPFESKMLWINFWNITIGTFTSFTHFRWNFAKATRPFSLRPHQLPIEWFTLRYAMGSFINYVTLSLPNPLMLYILTSVWVLRTSNSGQSMIFLCFSCKKLKKEEIRKKIEVKYIKQKIILSLHPDACQGFYSQKTLVKIHKFLQFVNKLQWPCTGSRDIHGYRLWLESTAGTLLRVSVRHEAHQGWRNQLLQINFIFESIRY